MINKQKIYNKKIVGHIKPRQSSITLYPIYYISSTIFADTRIMNDNKLRKNTIYFLFSYGTSQCL